MSTEGRDLFKLFGIDPSAPAPARPRTAPTAAPEAGAEPEGRDLFELLGVTPPERAPGPFRDVAPYQTAPVPLNPAQGSVDTLRALPQDLQPPAREAPGAVPGILRGVGQGLRDPIDAGAQLLPRGLEMVTGLGGYAPNAVSEFFGREAERVDRGITGQNAEYERQRMADGRGGTDWARIGGNVANPAGLLPGLRAAQLVKAGGTAGKLAQGAVAGGVAGASQPVVNVTPQESFAEQKGMQTATGMALGAGAELGLAGLSRLVQPKIADPQRLLLDEGVPLTPGQIVGRGMIKGAEDSATSIPILGDSVLAAQRRGVEGLNRAAANRALEPIGKKLPAGVQVGRDSTAYVKQALGDEYKTLLPKVQFKPDPQFQQEFTAIEAMAQSPAFVRGDQFRAIIRDKLTSKMTQAGLMNGQSFKQVEEGLSKEAKAYLGSLDPDQRKLGEALREVLVSLRSGLMRSNPAEAARLKAINAGYADFSILRRAAGSTGAEGGVFSPAQLAAAVRGQDGSVAHGAYATGAARMQDLSDAAKSVLPSTIADSNTARRGMFGAGVLGSVASGGLMGPLLGLAAGAGLYSTPAQRLAQTLMTARPAGAAPIGRALDNRHARGLAATLAASAGVGN